MDKQKQRKIYMKEWRRSNPERVKVNRTEWRKRNPEKVKSSARKYNRRYTQANRQFIDGIKLHFGCLNPACVCAGKSIKACCLDFHHITGKKKFNLGNAISQCPKAITKEMNKCTVLCAICHRLATWGELDASHLKTCNVNEKCLPA
jgi:hypothetical protein